MKRNFLILIVLLAIGLQSCDKYLDINRTPNAPSNSTPALVLPAAQASVAYIMGGQYQVLGGLWSQHWTTQKGGPQYTSIDAYNITVDKFNRPWDELYSGGLNDLEWIRKKAKAEENWKYYLIATTLQCYTYQILADLHDKIPFTEACNVEVPHYDDGATVYDGLITRLDEALAYDLTKSKGEDPAASDLVFKGNMTYWKQFANTLKLKIYLRQVYARPEVTSQGINAMMTSGAEFLTVNAVYDGYESTENKFNPYFATEWFRFQGINLGLSKTLHDAFNPLDLRINALFAPTVAGTAQTSLLQGEGASLNNAIIKASSPIIGSAQPVVFMTAAESKFLQAEAVLRNYLAGDAATLYNEGISSAFQNYGLTYTPITDYEFPATGNDNAKLEAIITQKWLSMVNIQGIESFLEHNRTHYPNIFVVSLYSVLPPNQMPKRLWYPESEVTNNPFTPAQSAGITVKVWWDKNTNN